MPMPEPMGAPRGMTAEAPDHDAAGERLHEAVQAEAHQGDAAGETAGQEGEDPFEEVIAHRQVGKQKGLLMQRNLRHLLLI